MAQTEITTSRRRGRAELIAALTESRAGIGNGAGELADLVNVPKRIKETLSDSPLKRSAVALVAGLVSSRLLSKGKSSSEENEPGWLLQTFPDFSLKGITSFLLKSYLEPDKADLQSVIKDRLRDYLK